MEGFWWEKKLKTVLGIKNAFGWKHKSKEVTLDVRAKMKKKRKPNGAEPSCSSMEGANSERSFFLRS
jgi:hypothetical protein